jgi:hypothetical protein
MEEPGFSAGRDFGVGHLLAFGEHAVFSSGLGIEIAETK